MATAQRAARTVQRFRPAAAVPEAAPCCPLQSSTLQTGAIAGARSPTAQRGALAARVQAESPWSFVRRRGAVKREQQRRAADGLHHLQRAYGDDRRHDRQPLDELRSAGGVTRQAAEQVCPAILVDD